MSSLNNCCCFRCMSNFVQGMEMFFMFTYDVPNKSLPAGTWGTPLSSFDGPPGGCDRCLWTHFCWPFAAGEVAQGIPGPPSLSCATREVCCGNAYGADCCLGGVAGCALCLYCLLWGKTRTRLRRAYNIPGSEFADHCITLLFPTCYLTQALNHLQMSPPPPQLSMVSTLPVAQVYSAPAPYGTSQGYQLPVAHPVGYPQPPQLAMRF